MKKSLASLELAALTQELQSLTNSKISQIYHQNETFLFQLHTKTGKQLLRIIPGKFLNLTKTKTAPPKPSSLCLQLRKHLNNSTITKIYQKDTERILLFELEKKEKCLLIIELFPPGNLVLTDKNYLTIACQHQQKFKARFIRSKTKYQFPQPQLNWKTLTESQLQNILQKSQKRNLATSLATDLGLGGLYAEEICKLNNINKNKLPKQTTQEEIKLILKTLKDFQTLTKKPQGFIYQEQIAPFPLKNQTTLKKTPTYNQAIDTLIPYEITSPYQKKINQLQLTIQHQQQAIQKQQQAIQLNTKKAETLYQHYQPLNKLLKIIQELKKSKSWQEIKQELQKEKKIKRIDLKEKKILIDL